MSRAIVKERTMSKKKATVGERIALNHEVVDLDELRLGETETGSLAKCLAEATDRAIKRAVREAFVHGQWSGYYKRTPPKNKPSICVRDHLGGLLFIETKYGVNL